MVKSFLQNLIDKFISNIKNDSDFEFYNEAGLQHEVLYFLRKEIGLKYKVYAEKNINTIHSPKKADFVKKEIDIYIQNKINPKEKYAIELKYFSANHNAIPRLMSHIIVDIKFLEELKKEAHFNECLFLIFTPKRIFYKGTGQRGIYKIFQHTNIIKSLTKSDTPDFLHESMEKFTLKKSYKFQWKVYSDNSHRYFTVLI